MYQLPLLNPNVVVSLPTWAGVTTAMELYLAVGRTRDIQFQDLAIGCLFNSNHTPEGIRTQLIKTSGRCRGKNTVPR